MWWECPAWDTIRSGYQLATSLRSGDWPACLLHCGIMPVHVPSLKKRAAEAEAPSPRRCRTGGRSDSADGALEDALGRFIKSNAALYDRVLTMEAVDVDEVLTTVRAAPSPPAPGVAAAKVSRAKLLAYLEREGVAVTHTSGRRARATRTRF